MSMMPATSAQRMPSQQANFAEHPLCGLDFIAGTSTHRPSRKFIYEILHNPTRIRAEDGPFPRPDTYEALGYGCSEGYYVLVASGRRQALKQPGGATGRTSSAT